MRFTNNSSILYVATNCNTQLVTQVTQVRPTQVNVLRTVTHKPTVATSWTQPILSMFPNLSLNFNINTVIFIAINY